MRAACWATPSQLPTAEKVQSTLDWTDQGLHPLSADHGCPRVLGHNYNARLFDALGLPSQTVNALGQSTAIQRDALGRITQLSFADSKCTTFGYDNTGIDAPKDTYDAAGRITSLTQQLYQPADSNPAHSSISAATVTWSVGYDCAKEWREALATCRELIREQEENGRRPSPSSLDKRCDGRLYGCDVLCPRSCI